MPTIINHERNEQIVALRREGKSLAETARLCRCSVSHVFNVCRKNLSGRLAPPPNLVPDYVKLFLSQPAAIINPPLKETSYEIRKKTARP